MVSTGDYIRFITKELVPRKLGISAVLKGMSPMEYGLVCSFLKYEENTGEHMTVTNLAKEMNMSVPQMSRMLKNLEERELISRVTDTNCRRNTFVVISEKGKALHEENTERFERFVTGVLSHFTSNELVHMMQIEKKFFDTVYSELDKLKTSTGGKE